MRAMSAISARIGVVIRRNRTDRGLSQESLAELAGLSRSFVGEIERGAAVPSVETLQRLADALGEKLSVLICQYERITERDASR